jgi:hypothetical protein
MDKKISDVIDLEKYHKYQWDWYLSQGFEFYEVLDDHKVMACKTPPVNDLSLGRANKIKEYRQFKIALDEAAQKGILNTFLRPEKEQAFQCFLSIYLNASEKQQKELLVFFKEFTGQRVVSLLYRFLDIIYDRLGSVHCLNTALEFSQEDLSLMYMDKNGQKQYSRLPENLYQYYLSHHYTLDEIHPVMLNLIKNNQNYLNHLSTDSYIYHFLEQNFQEKHWQDYISFFPRAKVLSYKNPLEKVFEGKPISGFSMSYSLMDIIDNLMLPGMSETFYQTLMEGFHQGLVKTYALNINNKLGQDEKNSSNKNQVRTIFFENEHNLSFTQENYQEISQRFLMHIKRLDMVALGTGFHDGYINSWLLQDKLDHVLPINNEDGDVSLIKL